MKSITEYIKQILEAEEQSVTKIKKLVVKFTTDPSSVTLVVPSNYGEADVQAYLDDVCYLYSLV
jgi:transcriptional regulator CtsR